MTEVTVWAGVTGGVAVGLYALLQLWLTGNPLGVSSGYSKACGLVSRDTLFSRGSESASHQWQLWFLLGLPLGGLLASWTSPEPLMASMSLGTMYDAVFPANLAARAGLLILGGVLMGVGARMADGCTSGHAIAGVSFLNRPSMVAGGGFFIGGIAMVQFMFRVLG